MRSASILVTSWCSASPRLPASSDRSHDINMSQTVTPWKFSVEGEAGLESDERMGAGPRWVGDRGGGEGDAAPVHGGVQAEDRQGRAVELGHHQAARPGEV